ncbi:MAG: efflux RND transporter periplasmic adaptor subunit [Candidatus Omnitrophica bacterium]|nr:efflux RND transporter periplasmic adaptor subunit [Candidatus Omnitrophota bacterium]
MNKSSNRKAAWLLLGAGISVGWILASVGGGRVPSPETGALVETQAQAEVWTCSMHPQIRLPKPGKCPICHMDLILLRNPSGAETQQSRQLIMSEAAKKLAEIQTAAVERRFVDKEVRMVGKVEYDETRLADITAWVSGRIDRLYVDSTGVPVRKGDRLINMYSPELLSAQEEYLQALRSVNEMAQSQLAIIKITSAMTVDNAREKLRLLGITAEQVQELEKRGSAEDHMTLYAPAGGVVLRKSVVEGEYVQTGATLLSIADLSFVWVRLDAYESDLPWLRAGQEVTFQSEAYPGEKFAGRISWIDPVLDSRTRTVKVRVNVENHGQLLKPGMFVRAMAMAHLGQGGKVIDASLEGKRICPMHPGVVRDGERECPVCGMDLVPASELGHAPAKETDPPLVIPATAPLITGARAVVYVEIPGAKKPTYEGREIVLGPRAGDDYVVRSGLTEGDRVVTHGNFKIDSSLQIQARPSMMSPQGAPQARGGGAHAH